MNTPIRYIAKAVIRPVREDNTYDIEAVQDPNGDWVAYEDYEVIENALRHHIEQDALRKVGEALHQRNIDSGAYNREKNEVIARLQAEVEHLQNCLGDAHAINAKEELKTWERIENLKAEVERLRKAGDAMAKAIKWLPQSISDHHLDAWNAAKEGKPSV